jgi:hypothetical protein
MLAVSSSNGSGGIAVSSKQTVNKFINPQKMPVATNYVHRISEGGLIDSYSRVKELLFES